MNRLNTRQTLLASLVAISLSGCGVSKVHHVREGVAPRNQDTSVVFRNTYYFRVFDPCKIKADEQHPQNSADLLNFTPSSDSLYRFTMTGKAHSLFGNVRFESGSLQAADIDPLGARVKQDNDGNFYYQSAEQAMQQNQQQQAKQSLEMLMDKYQQTIESEEPMQDSALLGYQQALKALFAKQVSLKLTKNTDEGSTIAALDAEIDKFKGILLPTYSNLYYPLTLLPKDVVTQQLPAEIEKVRSALLTALDQALYTRIQQTVPSQVAGHVMTQLSMPVGFTLSNTELNKVKANLALSGPPTALLTQTQLEDMLKKIASLSNMDASKASHFAGLYQTARDYWLKNTGSAPTLFVDDAAKQVSELINQKLKHYQAQRGVGVTIATVWTNHKADIQTAVANKLTGLLIKQASLLPDKAGVQPVFHGQQGKLFDSNKSNIQHQLVVDLQDNIDSTFTSYLAKQSPVQTALTDAIKAQAARIAGVPLQNQNQGQKGSESTPLECGKGINQHRGFQILGPEGWRTFNPDERLVMAMSIDSEPLINNLKELSSRAINAYQAQENEQDLTPLLHAQTSAAKAQQTLDNSKISALANGSFSQLQLCTLINQLNKDLAEQQSNTLDCKEYQQ